MGEWQKQVESWLASEQIGRDEAAEAALPYLFTALPVITASSDFVQRAVDAAWGSRLKRRRAWVVAGLAASFLFMALTSAALYGLFGVAGSGWLLTTGAAAATSFAGSVLVTAFAAVEWWITAAGVSRTVADLLTMPQGAAGFAGIALIGVAALSGMQRVLDTAWEIR